MKKTRVFALVVVASAILVTSTAAFAEQTSTNSFNAKIKQFRQGFAQVDPIQRLEKEKAKIQQELTDGKITKDVADKSIAEIDQKIKAQQDFNKLTTQQKKDKLISDYTTEMNKSVKDGKLTQEKADIAITNYKAKIEKWDGTGYPLCDGLGKPEDFSPKGMKGRMPNQKGIKSFNRDNEQFAQGFAKVDPTQKLENGKAKIQQELTDGKITKDEADKAIAGIDQKIKELQDFNKLTTEQKKDKLISDFTTSINDQVKNGKLAQAEADKAIANYKTKIEKWDGTGYPFFMGDGMKGFGGFRGHSQKQMAAKGPVITE